MRGIERAVERLFQTKANPEKTELSLVDLSPRCAESVRGRRVAHSPVDSQTVPLPGKVARKKNNAAENSADPRLRSFHMSRHFSPAKGMWDRLDRTLRAADLLLNTGGFRAIVVDMGDVGPEHARRVPLASWYRFRLQAEKLQTILILVTQTACANSCSSVTLRCGEAEEQWQCASEAPVSLQLLTGFRYKLSANRKRGGAQESFHPFKKKPVSAAETSWKSTTVWAR